MRTIDGPLSMRAQRQWRGALVICEGENRDERWVLERPGQEPIGLGGTRSVAHTSLAVLREAGASGAGEASE